MKQHETPALVDELEDDHPLWCVNEQIKGLLEGDGASEDHEDVLTFLANTGLPTGTVKRMHRAICCAERDHSGMLEALQAGPSTFHTLPRGEVCQCSQCQFIRLRNAAIEKATKT